MYQRQDEEATFAGAPAAVQKPVIHISQPTGQDTAFQRPKRKYSPDGDTKGAPASDPSTPQIAADTNVADASEPRRFHLKRSDAMLSASQYPTRDNDGFSRKRAAPALFVERKIKRISSRTVEKLQSAAHVQGPTISAEQDSSTPQDTLPKAEAVETSKTEPPRKFKKPGVAKLASKGTEQNAKTELPKSMTNPWNIDMDRMTDEMNAFALEQIGLNLQKADEEQKQRAKSHKGGLPSSQLKFKPKAPAKRYAERHPEATPEPADKDKAMEDADTGVSDTDDDEYIIETYVRVPASKMGDNVLPQNVGLLVFDAEPDMEYFYGEGSDSDDEWAEDQEDENGKWTHFLVAHVFTFARLVLTDDSRELLRGGLPRR